MSLKPFPLSKVYRLLEPGPVVMLTTAYRGQENVMTMAWHTMMEFTPPLIGCVVGSDDHSFEMLRKSRECVIAVPTAELAAKVVRVGNTTGAKIDKFAKLGLTRQPAALVVAPLLPDCYANIECRIHDTKLVNKYNFFVLEAVKAWVDTDCKRPRTLHHVGHGRFIVDGRTVKYPWRMSER